MSKQETADRLAEIQEQVSELMNEAIGLLDRGSMVHSRAKSYWYGQIKTALGDDEYAGQCMHSMQDTVEALEEEAFEEAMEDQDYDEALAHYGRNE